MSKAAAANITPAGVSAVSILVDLENLPTSDNATLVDGTPLGAGSFDLLSCAAGVHGDLRDQTQGTFIPCLGRRGAGHLRPNGPALIARDRAASAADGPRGTATPTTSSTGDGGRTDPSNLAPLFG